jgi:hypothetical protein
MNSAYFKTLGYSTIETDVQETAIITIYPNNTILMKIILVACDTIFLE